MNTETPERTGEREASKSRLAGLGEEEKTRSA